MEKLGIGFGLEHIGLAALRFPVVFSILIIAVSVFAGLNLRNLKFDGDITAVLPEESEAYRNYFAQKDEFRDFSRDVTVIVQSDRLMTADGLEDLRFLQLEVAISEVVQSAVTIFSAPDTDPDTGRIGSFFPEQIASDAQARALVANVLRKYPQAGSLIAPEKNTAVMLVTLDSGLAGGRDDKSYASFRELKNAVEAAAPEDFRVLYTGLTPIGITIVGALISDQLRLTLIGLVLGAGIAFYIFRSAVAAVICAIPPTLTALWSLGLFGLVDTPINYLSTVLPTLALILAFADGIVLYYRWQNSNALTSDLRGNLADALRRVGPASALTSITTLLAFFSFSFAPGSALKSFSAIGMASVSIAFLAVIMGLPIAAHWALRLGLVRAGRVRKPAFRGIGERFARLVTPRPRFIAALAALAVIALSVVHSFVTPEYRITDYLPKSTETREAETLANEIIGGRALIFFTVPAAESGSPFSPANLERLAEVEELAREVYPQDRIFSLRLLTLGLRSGEALAGLAEAFERAPAAGREGYLSRDGERMLVSVRIPSDQSIATTLEQIDRLRLRIDRLSYGDEVVITGFDVLMAREFIHLIDQLRTSLLIAIFLGVVIIGIATRSFLMAMVALTPNLLPVFTVELIVWLKGGMINISEVIALTIAFGIAIDNAVHVINVYKSERRDGSQPEAAINAAMAEVGPALAASTVIICVSTLVTQASIMPMVPVVGGLMIATLLVALLSNLIVLPANVLTLKRFARRKENSENASKAIAE